jgi:phosphoserine phosphatase SerB
MTDVQIGYLENKSQPWQALGKMSKEVAQTIILKAASSKNPNYNFEVLGAISEIRSQMEFALDHQLSELEKLIVFDMDDTILEGRFVDSCFEKFGIREQLEEVRNLEADPIIRSKLIATKLKGRSINELIEVVDDLPIIKDVKHIVVELKKRGYIIGIISDSYDCITNHIKNKLGMDFSLSNELEFSKSICTGEIKIPSFFFNRPGSLCKHILCKTNAILNIISKYGLKIENCIAIGDSVNDLCMIKESGLGIAFCSAEPLVNHHADVVISKPSFSELLNFAK